MILCGYPVAGSQIAGSMVFRINRLTDGLSTLLLAGISSVAIAAPAVAEVPLDWAKVRDSTSQVTLVSVGAGERPALVADCFCPGDQLTTSTRSRAEVVFNDGTLARVGEQTNLYFLPNVRRLQLIQGTAAVFVPPNQGRTTLVTPNAAIGLDSTGVVVRYLPSRGLTLVMALADSPSGPVSITTGKLDQETILYAGQMAFVSGDTLEIVEFDLLEFYQTSELMAGLHLDNAAYRPAADDPLAALRFDLLIALSQQVPFGESDEILDPSAIRDLVLDPEAPAPEADLVAPEYPTEELQQHNETPPGIVTPLPETAPPPPAETPPT